MRLTIFNALRNRASHMAANSLFYNWSLRGDVPDRLIVKPVDMWPGNAEYGQLIFDGQMPGHYSHEDLHGFVWLRDLRRLARSSGGSGVCVRRHARHTIQSWIERYGVWDAQSWDAGVCGQRIAMWISGHEFYADQAGIVCPDEIEDLHEFEDALFDSIARQARHISRVFSQKGKCSPIGRLQACKGLLYAGLAFEGCEAWVEQALDVLLREIDLQISGDGSHRSRSPEQLKKVLMILLDVRMGLSAGDYPLPDKIQHAIDRMGPALRFFRNSDKGLCVFQGAQQGREDVLDMIFTQSGVRGKVMKSLPSAGYERVTLGRTSLVMDCGRAPEREFDAFAHAAPLAFEMSYGRERVFVNCGTHPSDESWREALRGTAAHNTLILGHRNACEIREDGHFARRADKVSATREESKSAVLLEGQHNGYERLNGYTHRRRLYVSDQGHDVRGEDYICSQIAPAKPIDIAVRFHLHPRVMVSLIRDGQEALLRLPGGTGWRFTFSAGFLSLEESVYLGEGTEARKSKQMVIYGQTREKKAKIKWSCQKEG